MIYSISYELKKPDQNYEDLYEAIQSLGNWIHPLESTWLVSEDSLSAQRIWDKISLHMDNNDSVFINPMGNDRSGWLAQEYWNWITLHM